MFYKNALIGIENNFDSYPNMELQRLGYKNLYVREKTDDITHRKYNEYGFKTTTITRPLIISNLVEIVREHTDLITNKETLEEMLTFVRNTKGRPEAQLGAHDDLVMALAIAYFIKADVIFRQEPIRVEHTFNFRRERPLSYDYGEKIEVI